MKPIFDKDEMSAKTGYEFAQGSSLDAALPQKFGSLSRDTQVFNFILGGIPTADVSWRRILAGLEAMEAVEYPFKPAYDRRWSEFGGDLVMRFESYEQVKEFVGRYVPNLELVEQIQKKLGAGEITEEEANKRARETLRLVDDDGTLGAHGGDRKSDQGAENENSTLINRGSTAASYRVAKLKRDHPEIIPRMAAGEFKSVAAAERAAKGEPPLVRKTPIYAHWNDPDEAAQCIRERLSEDQVALLKAKL